MSDDDLEPTDSMRTFCRGVLESSTYRNALKIRVQEGTLHPSLEIHLWNVAYGRPAQRVTHRLTKKSIAGLHRLNDAQLAERLEELAQRARQLRPDVKEETLLN
jgi:hypothetical protein